MSTEPHRDREYKQVLNETEPTSAELALSVQDDIALIDLLGVFAIRKWLILKVTAVFTSTAVIVSLLLPVRYTASATILPPQQNTTTASTLMSQLSNLGAAASLTSSGLGVKNPNDLYVAMMRSRTVEDAMIQRFGLMQEYQERYLSDCRKVFEKRTGVDGSGKDGLIHISVQDHDPTRAAQLANGYIDQFKQLSEHLAITEASQRRLFFERQLEQTKENLVNAEESLKQTEQSTGLIQLDSQARALIESAASVRAQVAAKEVQIESMRSFATSENAQLIQAENELEALRSQLAKLSGGDKTGEGGLIVPKGQVPIVGLEYVRKVRDVKYYESISEILARQFEIAKLDEAKQGAVIQVVDSAVPPDRRTSPKRVLIVMGATAVGLLFGILAAVLQVGWLRFKNDPAPTTSSRECIGR